MGKAKTASKNNPLSRGTGAEKKKHNGKEVKPTKYVGTRIGHGVYMAVAYEDNGDLVIDPVTKRPMAWGAL